MFDMINIFEVFLPQLLRYPNPTDPLNGDAAALLMKDPKAYETRVKGLFAHLSYRSSSPSRLPLTYSVIAFVVENESKSSNWNIPDRA